MRIVQLLHGWPPATVGGCGLYAGSLAHALAEQGHAVAVLVPDAEPGPVGVRSLSPDPQDGPERRSRVEVFAIRAGRPTRWEHTWRQPAVDAAVAAWARRWRPDIAHVHHLSGHSWGAVRSLARAGARRVLTLHDYALPCARGQLVDDRGAICRGPAPERCAGCIGEQLALDPGTAALAAVVRRLPGLHQALRQTAAQRRGPPTAAAGARVADRLASAARLLDSVDALLAPSRDLCDRIAALGLRRPRHVPLPLLHPVPSAPTPPPGPVRFLFASTLIPTKGPHLLLEAFRHLPPGSATLTLAGPAPLHDGTSAFADALRDRARQTPGVRLLPARPHAAIMDMLPEHDVVVLPSQWPENSPFIVREAAAAGLPCIVGSEGGAAELAPGATPVPPADVAALVRALELEVERGRRRLAAHPSAQAPEHARWLASQIYAEPSG